MTMTNIRKQYRTDALIPKTGFWFGFLSVFNLFGGYQPTTYGHLSDAELDARALRADWGAVATDAHVAMRSTSGQTKKYAESQLSFKF
jgi:hypothetical protein